MSPLPPEIRRQLVAYLHEQEEMSFAEIGKEMGFGKSRAHRMYHEELKQRCTITLLNRTKETEKKDLSSFTRTAVL